jgi:hypothetical protein
MITKQDKLIRSLAGLIPRTFTGFGTSSPVRIWFDAIGHRNERRNAVIGVNLGKIQVGTIRQNQLYGCYVWQNQLDNETKVYETEQEVFFDAINEIRQGLPVTLGRDRFRRGRVICIMQNDLLWTVELGFVVIGFVQKDTETDRFKSFLGFDSRLMECMTIEEMEQKLAKYVIKLLAKETAAKTSQPQETWDQIIDKWIDK